MQLNAGPTFMTTLETLNQAVFLRLNADITTAAWKLKLAAATADYLIYLIPLILVCLWCWGNESQRSLALRAEPPRNSWRPVGLSQADMACSVSCR
jgi:hypothetical protein